MPRYVVKNTNGAVLGGYDTLEQAQTCADRWNRRYDSSKLVFGVKAVVIDIRKEES